MRKKVHSDILPHFVHCAPKNLTQRFANPMPFLQKTLCGWPLRIIPLHLLGSSVKYEPIFLQRI